METVHYVTPTTGTDAKSREVWIEGEAFFSVKPSSVPRAFLVHTASNMNVEVLGTTFNVVDRHGRMQVVLNSGKVTFAQ